MTSVNKVIIIGRLGKDPIISNFQNGSKIATFTMATSERWTDKATGEKKERTEWHTISVTSPVLADFAERYLQKGQQVYVEGRLQTREWTDKQGVKRYSTEINVGAYNGQIALLESKQTTAPAEPAPVADNADAGMDDDIPF